MGNADNITKISEIQTLEEHMPEYDVEKTRRLVVKSIRSIQIALQEYKNSNKPLEDRIESCSMHSVIGWLRLFLAFYLSRGINCIFDKKKEDDPDRYWSLGKCLNYEFFIKEEIPLLHPEDKEDLEELIRIRNASEHSYLDEINYKMVHTLEACFAKFGYYKYRMFKGEYEPDKRVEYADIIPILSLKQQEDLRNRSIIDPNANVNVTIRGNLQGAILTLLPNTPKGALNLPSVQKAVGSRGFNNGKIPYAADVAIRRYQEHGKESTTTPVYLDVRDEAQLHRYILFSYRNSFPFRNKVFNHGNIGDNIQTIATKHAILKIDKQADFVTVRRDQLISYENKLPAICVMQGWFEHRDKGLDFLPGPSVVPVWLGTHWYRYTREQLSHFLKICKGALFLDEEIGCRDKATLEFCNKQGIPAYFSRCLTLTLERRKVEPKSPKIFVVTAREYAEEFRSFLPQDIERDAIPLQQQNLPLGAEPGPYEEKAEELLARYHDEAGLVITTALRCALPCIAMGIPTVFVRTPNIFDSDRISGTEDIIPIWTYEDLQRGKVDFSPKVPNIEPLKGWMIENLDLSIRKAKSIPVDEDHLREVRQKIENFSAI